MRKPAKLLFLVIICALVGYFFVYPALTPNILRGILLDATIVPQADGSARIWVLTEDSFRYSHYDSSSDTMTGDISGLFCKTRLYIVNPFTKKVEKQISTDYDDIVIFANLAVSGDRVIQIIGNYGKNEPQIMALDPKTGDLALSTQAFIGQWPQFKSGLAEAQYFANDRVVRLKSKDGIQARYGLDTQKLELSEGDRARAKPGEDAIVSRLILGKDKNNEDRKILYRIRGPQTKINDYSSYLESSLGDAKEPIVNGIAWDKLSDKVYLSGIIYYQDKDCAIIVSVDQLGKTANRVLTCVSTLGTELWTVRQNDLFDIMAVDLGKDDLSSVFFTKDNIRIDRQNNLVLLQYRGKGILVFDFRTGKKLLQM